MLAMVALLACGRLAAPLTIFAASSLRNAFTEIGRSFERDYGKKIRFSFAGSQQLAAQIANGAPADVLAAADERTLAKLAYDRTTYRVFATNKLVVIVPKGNRSFVTFRDLSRAHRVVVAAEPVPAGTYTAEVLRRAGHHYGEAWLKTLSSHIVSKEQSVRAVLTKVALREADAGIVYATDAAGAAAAVRAVAIPASMNVKAKYPVAVLKGAPDAAGGKAFAAYLLGPRGRQVLRAHGFGPP